MTWGQLVPPGYTALSGKVTHPWHDGNEDCFFVFDLEALIRYGASVHLLCARGSTVIVDQPILDLDHGCLRSFLTPDGSPLAGWRMQDLMMRAVHWASFTLLAPGVRHEGFLDDGEDGVDGGS